MSHAYQSANFLLTAQAACSSQAIKCIIPLYFQQSQSTQQGRMEGGWGSTPSLTACMVSSKSGLGSDCTACCNHRYNMVPKVGCWGCLCGTPICFLQVNAVYSYTRNCTKCCCRASRYNFERLRNPRYKSRKALFKHQAQLATATCALCFDSGVKSHPNQVK